MLLINQKVSIPDRDYVRFKLLIAKGLEDWKAVSIPDRDYVRFKPGTSI